MATMQSIKGTTYPTFMIGKSGPTVFQGTGLPSGSGNDGDVYIRVGGTAKIYQQVLGNWTPLDSKQKAIISKSIDYQVTQSDQIILVNTSDGARTITLGNTATLPGNIITIKDSGGLAGTYAITIVGQNSQTIDGQTSYVISSNYGKVQLVSDGANWFVV